MCWFSDKQDQRQRPPESLACPRNRLTAYIGKVLSLSRREDRTVIRIRTDWDTAESVMLKHPGTDDPSKWFLMRGQPFRPEDWPTIEVSRNKLKPDVRATAWVCDDGSNPIVDWQTPSESRRSALRAFGIRTNYRYCAVTLSMRVRWPALNLYMHSSSV